MNQSRMSASKSGGSLRFAALNAVAVSLAAASAALAAGPSGAALSRSDDSGVAAGAQAQAGNPGGLNSDARAPASPAGPGIWQKHQYAFTFMGFTSTYSCDGLADKLKDLLLAAGARADARSAPTACAAGFGRPDKFASANLTFYTLSPVADGTSPASGASPANGASPAPGGASPADAAAGDGTPVPGEWRPVAFFNKTPLTLGLGDCELVEQFAAHVLPLFTTRNLDNHTVCVPNQNSGSLISLKFESLTAVPTPRGIKPSLKRPPQPS